MAERGAPTRDDVLALDAADPLAAFRERFVITDPERLYLDGNSLGRLPIATRDRLAAMTAEWGDVLVSGWPDWIDAPRRTGDLLAEHVLGARPGEVLACDSTTVNLYKLAEAVLATRPEGALVTEQGNFPTDRYVLEGLAARYGREARFFDGGFRAEVLDDTALLVLSHVDYRSGALVDMASTQALCDEAGVPLIWDLSHSAGAVPIDLAGCGARLAVGCTYKYLNAGPGAPAYLYVAEALQPELRSPIWGWFGQAEQFAMERPYEPVPSVERFLAGTPPILGLAAVEEGAKLTGEAGARRLREKSITQTELMAELHDAWLEPLGFSFGSPRDPQARGSHVALRHREAWQICQALVERANVVPDFRGPDVIRLASTPLYTRYVDLYDAFGRLRDLVALGAHRELPAEPGRVT
jgi:kynureninase